MLSYHASLLILLASKPVWLLCHPRKRGSKKYHKSFYDFITHHNMKDIHFHIQM